LHFIDGYEHSTDGKYILTVFKQSGYVSLGCVDGYFYGPDGRCIKDDHCVKIKGYFCVACEEGFFLENTKCHSIAERFPHCLKSKGPEQWVKCEVGYYLDETNTCQQITNCNKMNVQGCVLCNKGYKEENRVCVVADDPNCFYQSETCFLCAHGFVMSESGVCVPQERNVNKNKELLFCGSDEYLEKNKCNKCADTFNGCLKCNPTECLLCSNGFFRRENGTCEKAENCATTFENKCIECEESYSLNHTHCQKTEYCKYYSMGECVECEVGYLLNENSQCISITITNCSQQNSFGCLRCDDGFYLNA